MAAPIENVDLLAKRNIASRMDVDPPLNSEENVRDGEGTEKELLKTISDLRAQVRKLETEVIVLKGAGQPALENKPQKFNIKQRKQKPPKPFNFKRFNKRHIALRIAYLGWDYHGFASQENINNTIEYHLFDALTKTKLIEDRPTSNYSRCGRTDKGVSAFGQVITLDVRTNLHEGLGVIVREGVEKKELPGGKEEKELNYVHVLNRVLPPDIQVLAWAPVDPSFSARFDAKYRTYKYFFPKGNLDISVMREASQKLIGEHDFRNFCKMDVANGVVSFIRRIVSIDIQPLDDREDDFQMYELTVSGFAFLYHQVRCTVAILFMIGQHKEKPEIIDELLDVSKNPCKPQYSMAAEGPLVLYDCGFEGIKWIYDDDPQRHNITSLQSIWTNHCIRYEENTALANLVASPGKKYTVYSIATVVKRMLDGLEVAMVPVNKSENQKEESVEVEYLPWYEARNKISKQSERLILGLPSSTHQPLLKRKLCESLEDRIAHFTKKGRGPKVKQVCLEDTDG